MGVLGGGIEKKWCRKRESNPQLIITNDLLYHLTIAAWLAIIRLSSHNFSAP